jgi:hypothetical protein
MSPAQAKDLERAAALEGESTKATALGLLAAAATEATRVVLAVQKDEGRGAVGEAVADLAQTRAELSGIFARTEASLSALIRNRMTLAVQHGFVAEIKGQNEALPESVRVVPGDDLAGLSGYPVIGNTPAETGRHNAATWRFGAESVVGQAAAFGGVATLGIAMLDLANRSAAVAGRAVEEAFVAGQGAARRTIGLSLQRAFRG